MFVFSRGLLSTQNFFSEQSEARERLVERTLSLLDKRTKGDSQVRALFYTQLTQVISDNPRIPASEAVVLFCFVAFVLTELFATV